MYSFSICLACRSSEDGLVLPAFDVAFLRCSALAGSCAQQNSLSPLAGSVQGVPSLLVARHCMLTPTPYPQRFTLLLLGGVCEANLRVLAFGPSRWLRACAGKPLVLCELSLLGVSFRRRRCARIRHAALALFDPRVSTSPEGLRIQRRCYP